MKTILVTGGAGYIGSHTCVELLAAGYDVFILDNLSNSSRVAIHRIGEITGRTPGFIEGDVNDVELLHRLFAQQQIDAVIHFAGLKSVGESNRLPLEYYHHNVTGTLSLLRAMSDAGCRCLVFSSSATVYGDPESNPISEDFPLSATNPYGRSKLIIEEVLRDLHLSNDSWNISLLRYFNPAGAHPSGRIGEDPADAPNNLMPYVAQVAAGQRPCLSVFGNDYATRDGTGVRDYIHVVDLARGHIKALQKLAAGPGLITHNLGTGRGYSVLEMIAAFERACGLPIPYQFVDRRAGDVAECYANPTAANTDLGWRAELGLDAMCADGWRWQSQNPAGYAED